MKRNEYIPYMATIKEIRKQTSDIKGFILEFDDPELREKWTFKPGQFVEVSAFGHGEVPISIASSPTQKGEIELVIRNSGSVTAAFHEMKAGDKVGLRGPYGNWWPFEKTKGKKVTIVAGGIGLAAVTNILRYMLDNPSDYENVQLMYGARDQDLLVFTSEYEKWRQMGADVQITCDRRAGDWPGNVGMVTCFFNDTPSPELKKVEIPEDATLIVCGPPIMIHFCCLDLLKAGFKPENIYVSLEGHMKCGIGKCGHCNIGHKYVCKDGPIYTYAEKLALEGG